METTIDSVIIDINTTADSASKSLKTLVSTLTSLNGKLKPAISNLSKFRSNLNNAGNSINKFNNNANKTRGVDNLTNKFSRLSKSVLGFLGLDLSSDFLGQAINESNQYIENLNLFYVSMGENAEKAKEFTDNFSEALGVDPSNAMRYMGIFNSLAEGFGISSDKAYIMSKNLTQLSYDMSSYLNIPIEQAMQKIKSGFSGEIEPMRAVGIALDQATLQETAYRLGIKKTVSEMTRAQKTQLLYYQTMENKTSKLMQGDMARTLLQPANALRVLKQQFTLLARAIGNIFIPILTAVIPYVMVLTKWLTALAQTIANFFGFELPTIDTSNLGDISGGIGDIEDSASGATKELKKMLAPFDELNVIDFGKDGGSGSGSAGAGGELDIPLPEYDALTGLLSRNLEEIETKMKDILVAAIGIAGALVGWKLGDWLGLNFKQKLGLSIALSSLTFYVDGIAGIANGELTSENFMQAFASSAGLGIGVGMLTGNWKLALIITVAAMSLSTGLGIGEWIKQNFPDSIDLYIDKVNLRWDEENLWGKIWKTVVVILGTIGDVIRYGVQQVFGQEFGDEFLWNIVNSIPIVGILTNIADVFVNGMDSHLLTPVKEYFFDNLDTLINQLADWVEKIPIIGEGLANGIRSGLNSSKQGITTTLEDVNTSSIEAARSKINLKANNAGLENGNNYMQGLKDKINQERNNLTTTMQETVSQSSNNSKQTFSNSGTMVGTALTDNLKSSISNSQSSITSTLENTNVNSLNNSKTKINLTAKTVGTQSADNYMQGLKDKMNLSKNSLETDLDKTGEEVGKSFGDSISDNMKVNNSTLGRTLNSSISGAISRIKNNNWSIFGGSGLLSGLLNFKWSYFEDGGFPTKGQMFIANEAGPELIGNIGRKSAVANNDQIIEGIRQGVAAGVSEAMPNQQKGPINVYIGNKKVYSGYGEYANTENNMYGSNVIRV